MIGLSCYILVDTYFISKSLGSKGIAALNFSIPIYSLINGTGLMVGIGGATRYCILSVKNKTRDANLVFTNSIKFGIGIGILYLMIGIFGSKFLALGMGTDVTTLPLTRTYISTILIFSPFFILNSILIAFVRNDNNPKLSMIAMLIGSISNIVLDYIFIFIFDMGIFGAAFATCLSPIVSINIIYYHFVKKLNNFMYIHGKIKWKIIIDIIWLGSSSLINEVSSAIVLITFNKLIINMEGNLGVASYGIVANLSLVCMSIFIGIAQGIQPLISENYGMKNKLYLRNILKLAISTSVLLSVIIYLVILLNSKNIVEIFNSEKNLKIMELAEKGIILYFTGLFFAGINIIIATYFSSTDKARIAFTISILRGCILIIPMVLLLSYLFHMTGVWLSFISTEIIVTIISFMFILKIN